jgi:hypothetical protein
MTNCAKWEGLSAPHGKAVSAMNSLAPPAELDPIFHTILQDHEGEAP